ncbi:flavin monoamine oxidase family protein [Rhodopila sp.]|uniref:flavin monoamine oxidase family protein n=1 Tax=Rhodopila sp. TaxID=2480087 RepID=UPI003D0FD48D
MTITRRTLIHQVGRAGGVAAAYRTMAAMGLLAVPAAHSEPPSLPPNSDGGGPIVILGAGIAGMVAALELQRAGYDCNILEARARPGGRNWSLRAGDTVAEASTIQTVAWDAEPHLYFNPGPARLPFHHQGILGYCRELGVPLEVMCNDNRGALMQDDQAFDGRPQRNAAVVNDSRGYVAELAAKAVDHGLLDAPVSDQDRERLHGFLRAFGALDHDMAYRGSARSGYLEPSGGGLTAGKIVPPLDLRRLVQADFWQGPSEFGEFYSMAATMMQPVGGMGRIGEAFGRRLGDVITYNAEVTQLRRQGDGAQVVWRDRRSNQVSVVEAAHVLCTIPCPVLRRLDTDFSSAVRAALAAVDYVPAGKIAFQADRRFWELDAQIYGGISWTSRDITQIWYPSAGLQQARGILVGAYIWSDDLGHAFAAKAPDARIADALADGEHLHPGYGKSLRHAISVAWPNIPFNEGAWAEWTSEARAQAYPVLLDGDGPFTFAGEHLSHITGWQEGAVVSAHYAIARITERIKAAN